MTNPIFMLLLASTVIWFLHKIFTKSNIQPNPKKIVTRPTTKSPVSCRYCHQIGHSIGQCRKRIDAERDNQTTPKKIVFRAAVKLPVSCRYCRKIGHSIRECHKRIDVERRKQARYELALMKFEGLDICNFLVFLATFSLKKMIQQPKYAALTWALISIIVVFYWPVQLQSIWGL